MGHKTTSLEEDYKFDYIKAKLFCMMVIETTNAVSNNR